jgi:hypothetical protein
LALGPAFCRLRGQGGGALTVEMEMPKSRAICLSGSLFLRRQLLEAGAMLAPTSQ